MKTIYLSLLLFILSFSTVLSQTYTITQNVTGNSFDDIRGQSITPSMQGSGSGNVGADDTVYLEKVRFYYGYQASSQAEILYLYSSLPHDISELDSGEGGQLIGKSTNRVHDWGGVYYYHFDWIPLHKDNTYYLVFREDVDLEVGGGATPSGSYSGGSAIRNVADTIHYNEYMDTRFAAFFSVPPSNEAEIINFNIQLITDTVAINSDDQTVVLTVDYGSGIGYITVDIELSPGATYSPNNFSYDFSDGPITFTVTAEDGITQKDWEVSVVLGPSYFSSIEAFSLPQQVDEAIIYEYMQEVDINVLGGTDLTSLTPTIEISEGATISPQSGVPVDFSSGNAVYTVTAENGVTQQEWKVNVTMLSNASNFESFSFTQQFSAATISIGEYSVSIVVAEGTDLSALAPTFEVSAGAYSLPASGTLNDFSSGQATYTIVAEDRTTQEWVVYVSIADPDSDTDPDPNTTAINTLNDIGINVYPTVSKGTFYVEQQIEKLLVITIFNSMGQVVKQVSSSDLQIQLNLNSFGKGVYLIRFNSPVGSGTSRIIVQ